MAITLGWLGSTAVDAIDSPFTLVQTIDTSGFPSPDPSGIVYLPAEDLFLISDSEINETPLYAGKNVYKMTRNGTLVGTYTTEGFSDEPTGVAFDPTNGHCYFSDDTGSKAIYEVDPGNDGQCLTADDSVSYFKTKYFSSYDPEDVLFSQGVLYVVDGKNAEVYRLLPGPNGRFDGTPPKGDDLISSFDTFNLGITDPEGIGVNLTTDTLYVVGRRRDLIIEVTPTGQLVRNIDISLVNPLKPAAVVLAPSSADPDGKSLYLVARGVDNNSDPNENDGKIYELQLTDVTGGNLAPDVDAGPYQSITLPNVAQLDGTVTDDGLPAGTVTTLWSKVSGSGEVTFTDAAQLDTQVTFSEAGSYVLRLTASDGELISTDEVNIDVVVLGVTLIFSQRIAIGQDDAEEKADGNMKRSSSDLELVYDGSDQAVGLRFTDVTIPRQATILNAYVQFQADETKSVATNLTIEADATNDADYFLNDDGNITSRPRTSNAVFWDPVPWVTVGEAGPAQRTPNIASVVQEIIDRPGWVSGNALALIITGTGERVAESSNGDPSAAPLLYVEYRVD